jgi:uncharacterized protein
LRTAPVSPRLVSFGSRARGEARPDSDYGIAVFLRDMPDRWREFDRLDGLSADILLRHFAVVQAPPYRERS